MAVSLQTLGISKQYPGTVALHDVSLRFEAGKVSALLGKNGAGKSTLVKILAGTLQPTSGQILIDGRPVRFRSAADAFRQGIATVYQELSLIPALSVAENILLGRLPRKPGTLGLAVDWPAARRRAAEVLAEMGVALDVRQPVARLGVARQQVVEIAKAMSFRPSVLMLDEPTSALARHETDLLFAVIRRLAAAGTSVLYITHRLQELALIADSVTVLRDGRHVGSLPMADAAPAAIVRLMFGEIPPRHRPAELPPAAPPLLEARRLTRAGGFRDVSFTLHEGEILGLAGMLGSGRTELLRALFGADPLDSGEILLAGRPFRPSSPRAAKHRGIALIPENRKEQALILPLSIRTNISLASLDRLGFAGFLRRRDEQRIADDMTRRLAIALADAGLPVETLSGGNQQKIVVGKWLNTHPRVILFDEPTRGIDVQAKQQIFRIMADLARRGIACIFVSSELQELLEVCHRILIMKSGAVAGEVRPDGLSADELVLRCLEPETPPLERTP